MKRFRFVYYFGSIMTECYYKAENKEQAIIKFRKEHGDSVIKNIEEVS